MAGIPVSFLYAAMRVRADFTHREAKMGTGFFVRDSSGSGQLLLVTNRHLLEPFESVQPSTEEIIARQGQILKNIQVEGRFSEDYYYIIELQDYTCHFSLHSFDDVAVVSFKKLLRLTAHNSLAATQPLSTTFTINNFFDMNDLATEPEFGTDILPCDQVAFPCFHEWVSEQDVRPTFRVGWVVSDPRHPLRFEKVSGDALLIEGFSTDGASGAPVIALPKGIRTGGGLSGGDYRPFRLIGVNAGHFKGTDVLHANISYCFKSTIIRSCITNFRKQ
jgi:hypothetical protein